MIRVFVAPDGAAGNYTASLDDGEIIVRSSRQPLLDACRVLIARGLKGPVEMWDRARPYSRLSGQIEALACLEIKAERLRRGAPRAQDRLLASRGMGRQGRAKRLS